MHDLKTKRMFFDNTQGKTIEFEWPEAWPRILIPIDALVSGSLAPFDFLAYLFSPPKGKEETKRDWFRADDLTDPLHPFHRGKTCPDCGDLIPVTSIRCSPCHNKFSQTNWSY